jgi:DNA-binding NtrC family response regulator
MGKQCILVVDDEEMVRTYVRAVLERENYSVVDFSGAREALAGLSAIGSRIDAAISDITMPGMNGIDFARELLLRLPGTPVLMISGSSDFPVAAGRGWSFLAKPFGPAALVAQVRGLLSSEMSVTFPRELSRAAAASPQRL